MTTGREDYATAPGGLLSTTRTVSSTRVTQPTAEGAVARGGRDGSSTEPEGICAGGTIISFIK